MFSDAKFIFTFSGEKVLIVLGRFVIVQHSGSHDGGFIVVEQDEKNNTDTQKSTCF